MSHPPATTTPPTQQLPHIPHQPNAQAAGGIVGHFNSVVGQADNLVQRFGVTLAAILLLTMLALASLYIIKDGMYAVIAIYVIALAATIFTRWKQLG